MERGDERPKLAEPWILGGLPRTMPRARALNARLEGRRGGSLMRVIALEVLSDHKLARRIVSGRVHSQATRMVYPIERGSRPPVEHMAQTRSPCRDDEDERTLRKDRDLP